MSYCQLRRQKPYASGIFFLSSLKSTSDHMNVLREPGNWRPCIFPATYSNFLGSLCKMACTDRPIRSLWGPQRGGGSPSTLWIMPGKVIIKGLKEVVKRWQFSYQYKTVHVLEGAELIFDIKNPYSSSLLQN